MLNKNFWAKVDKNGPNGCWVWTAGKNNKGYGLSRARYLGYQERVLVHRLSYEDAGGFIPKGAWVLHKCDNRPCVNPSHLFLGNAKDNVADMIAKGRDVRTPMRGTRNGNAILTDDKVIAMRKAYIAGKNRFEVAKMFGMSSNAVSDIINGRSWRHLLGKNGSPSLDDLKAVAHKNTRSSAKLDHKDVSKIKAAIASGEQCRSIAKRFGVHFATISDIKNGKTWK
jgi:hypothetical protein